MYTLNVFISYMLMLAVMSFNVGYFVCIIAGLSIGYVLNMIFFPVAAAPATAPGFMGQNGAAERVLISSIPVEYLELTPTLAGRLMLWALPRAAWVTFAVSRLLPYRR